MAAHLVPLIPVCGWQSLVDLAACWMLQEVCRLGHGVPRTLPGPYQGHKILSTLGAGNMLHAANGNLRAAAGANWQRC